MNVDFKDTTWIKIRLENNNEFLLGCVYRSPQSDRSMNQKLRDLLGEASRSNSSHIWIAGDFNYPHIDWKTWTTGRDSIEGE